MKLKITIKINNKPLLHNFNPEEDDRKKSETFANFKVLLRVSELGNIGFGPPRVSTFFWIKDGIVVKAKKS
jgi:hypothetical protein